MAKGMKTADQMAASWQQAMAAPNTAANYTQGINRVTENPMAQAASDEAMQNYANGVQQSITSGKRRDSLMAASFSDWKANAAGQGAQRLASGAQKAKNKTLRHFQKWTPIYQQASQAAAAVTGPKSMATAMAKIQASLQVMMQAAGRA